MTILVFENMSPNILKVMRKEDWNGFRLAAA